MNLTVIVLTKNEEENIVDCLESVSFADELIVIDDESTDRTVELAKQFTTNILTHALGKNFASQRNFALNSAHGRWVLFIDADERVSQKLRVEIERVVENEKEASGFYIKREDFIWGTALKHGEVANIKILRLARNRTGKWKGRVHETWRISGRKKELRNVLMHTPHPTMKSFVDEIDAYTTLRKEELLEEKRKARAIDIVLYPIGKFVVCYFFKKGYKDGIAGFIYAGMMSLHSFLVRGKTYISQHEE